MKYMHLITGYLYTCSYPIKKFIAYKKTEYNRMQPKLIFHLSKPFNSILIYHFNEHLIAQIPS